MAAARCYECPSCGGLVREASRNCNYCGNPVATVHCGRCFMMNVTEALHCIGCGAELGLLPVQDQASATWFCPRCRTQHLDAFSSDDGILFDCPRCGGQFIPNAVLQVLVRRHQSIEIALTQRFRPNNPLTQEITYAPCPSCGALMLRRNFGKVSGVIVDVCAAHGTWFDMGELARILAFVGKGGLQRGQLIDGDEKRALAAARADATGPAAQLPNLTDESLSWEDMRETARAFVQWVQGVLR